MEPSTSAREVGNMSLMRYNDSEQNEKCWDSLCSSSIGVENLWKTVKSFSNTSHYTSGFQNGNIRKYRGADKSLAWPGRKQATTTENFEFDVILTVHRR